jgi:UDP:flavonoid glycosyltransferase YjiC (YdhE family)
VSPIRTLQSDSLPEGVEDFLAFGDPPVYVGFGSMSTADAGRLLDVALQSAAALNVRMIVPAAWATAANRSMPDSCLAIGRVSHGLLFPRLAAVVHHGGAGTTMAAVRAEVPQVVVPHAFDQFYWGNRVFEVGIGPKPPRHKRLSSRTLTSALREVLGSLSMAEKAQTLSHELDGRDGAIELARVLDNDPSVKGAGGGRLEDSV